MRGYSSEEGNFQFAFSSVLPIRLLYSSKKVAFTNLNRQCYITSNFMDGQSKTLFYI